MIYCFLEEQVNRTVGAVKLIESSAGTTVFKRPKLCFHGFETKVSSRWNFSSKQEKQKFQAGETKKLCIAWCVLVLVDNFVCYNWISLLNIL